MLEQTSVYTFVQIFLNCFFFDAAVCTVSAISLVKRFATRYLREHVFVVIDDYSSMSSRIPNRLPSGFKFGDNCTIF